MKRDGFQMEGGPGGKPPATRPGRGMAFQAEPRCGAKTDLPAPSKRVAFLVSCALGLGAMAVASPITAPVKLSDPFPSGGGVYYFRPSPTQGLAIYVADQETDNVFEIYGVSYDGGPPVKLNGPIVSGGDVSGPFLETPDGLRLIYRADQEIDETTELFSVPVAGGAAVKLNGPMASNGSDVGSDFTISPDSSFVVYRARSSVSAVDDLYSVPVGGGAAVKLNGPAVATDGITNGSIVTPDSSRVVYCARHDNSVFDLYSVDIRGGASTKLNGALVTGGRVFDYKLTPDGSRVIYTAEQDTDSVLELYSVPVTGGMAVKLNAALPFGGDVSEDFQITPDSSRVVYIADQDADGVDEIYSVPVAGGAVVRLNPPLIDGGDVWNAPRAQHFLITPDSSRVVYLADQDTDDVVELFSVATGGGSATKLNGPLPPEGDVGSHFSVSADGTRVVYLADQDTDGISELYNVPVTGGVPVKLNGPLPNGGAVSTFRMDPDGSRIVYAADQDADGVVEIYSIPIGGGFPVKLTPDLVDGGNVSGYRFSSDGRRLVYSADQETDGVVELYSIMLACESYGDFEREYDLNTPPDGDEDGDGVSNILEYLAGGHPLKPGPPLRTFMTGEDGPHAASFVLALGGGSNVRLEIETSTDIADPDPSAWTTVAVRENGVWSGSPVDLVRIGNGLVLHTIHESDSAAARFFRLKATLPQ